jgi:hypothetical protein
MTAAYGFLGGAVRRHARNRFTALLALALAGCSHAPANFSQYPGFAEHYATHPRGTSAATAEEQTLLQRFRPRFMLPAGHAGLIDFYNDYIAHGILCAAHGSVLSNRVTATILNLEAEYDLEFLPPDDAFYSFAGFLGERRRLPGRDGPPSADYNIYPPLKPLGHQLVAGFFRAANREDLLRFETSYEKTGDSLAFVRTQAPVLGALLFKPD